MPTTTIKTSDGAGFDTYGYYDNTEDRGSETTMVHYNQGTYQPVLKFDLSSLAGAVILSATLRVYMEANGNGSVRVGLAQINDPYYNSFVESSVYNWSTISGHSPTLTANIVEINVGFTAGWKEWSSAALATAIQSWIDGSLTNNGFILTTTGTWNPWNNRQFRTKEYGDGSSAPQLVIEYIKYNERGRIQTVLATAAKINEAQAQNEQGKTQTIPVVADGTDTQAQNEQGKTQTIPVVADGTDTQAMTDAGRIQAAVTTAGEHDAYISAEQERLTVGLAITAELVHHIIRGEAGRLVATAMVLGGTDTQAMLDTGKILTANMVNGRSFGETKTMVETGALLLMKAWIVSRFPWAFSEVDLKTATFSERRNINT